MYNKLNIIKLFDWLMAYPSLCSNDQAEDIIGSRHAHYPSGYVPNTR